MAGYRNISLFMRSFYGDFELQMKNSIQFHLLAAKNARAYALNSAKRTAKMVGLLESTFFATSLIGKSVDLNNRQACSKRRSVTYCIGEI